MTNIYFLKSQNCWYSYNVLITIRYVNIYFLLEEIMFVKYCFWVAHLRHEVCKNLKKVQGFHVPPPQILVSETCFKATNICFQFAVLLALIFILMIAGGIAGFVLRNDVSLSLLRSLHLVCHLWKECKSSLITQEWKQQNKQTSP